MSQDPAGATTKPAPYEVQVTFDANSPHDLADWWAEILGWEVEPQDEDFIRRMISEGYATSADTKTHRGALVWTAGAAIRHPQGAGPRILFQWVPEPKAVKNRVHLDLCPAGAPSNAELERFVALGARQISSGQQGTLHWVTLTDPEGNELCLPVADAPATAADASSPE